MSNTNTCIFTDNQIANKFLMTVISSVFKDKNEQTSVINLLCDLSRYSSVCKKLGGADCVQLRKDMFNEILSMGGPISKEIDSEIDLTKLIPGMQTYVNEANATINISNNFLQKGDMAIEDVIKIINKYISIFNNITSYLPLGQNKLATINTININTISRDCKEAENTILNNKKLIDDLKSQLLQINNDFTAYKTSNPKECKACPEPKNCPACQACPQIKCQDQSCPDVSTDCSDKLSNLNYQINGLKSTKENMGIIVIIIVSILGLLLIWLILNLSRKKNIVL